MNSVWNSCRRRPRSKDKRKPRNRLLSIWLLVRCLLSSMKLWWSMMRRKSAVTTEETVCKCSPISSKSRITLSTSIRDQEKCQACSIRCKRTQNRIKLRQMLRNWKIASSSKSSPNLHPPPRTERKLFSRMMRPWLYSLTSSPTRWPRTQSLAIEQPDIMNRLVETNY